MTEKTKLTPVMQQYVDIKAENPDALLMFRLGDFYESFFDDACIISKILSLVLTRRGTDENGADIPMCGIPWHAADSYFGRLVKSGFKVALVEQVETPNEAKERGHKYIERKVVRVLTPGTLTDDNLLNPKKSNFLISISQIETNLFDIVGCDISTGELFIGTTANLIDELARLNPAEVIYAESCAEQDVFIRLRSLFKTTAVFDKLYNRIDIDEIRLNVFGQNIQSNNKDSAINILAGYLFNTQRDAKVSFRTPHVFKTDKQLLIDSATWKSLEIDAPINDGGLCLLDVIDLTLTAAGGRKLRSYLRCLSADVDELFVRQQHIQHFIEHPDICNAIEKILTEVTDVSRSLSRLVCGRGYPKDLRNVANFLQVLPKIKALSDYFDTNLQNKFSVINCHENLSKKLNSALNEELPTFFRDGNVIRNGFDIALDNMRNLSHGAKESIATMQAEYIKQTDINTLKIKYNNILGYFVEVPSNKADGMMKNDSGFIHRQSLAGNMRFTTSKLIDLDNAVRSSVEKSFAIENEIITNLISDIKNVSDDLLNMADMLADLDVWYSLTQCAKLYSWVCPNITNKTDFKIYGGRHPVIEYALHKNSDKFVKNDCDLSQKAIALLTGPNMAGKSTYLRQNAILIVLAHLGSYVPAKSAIIGICDQLFSRVGASDNLAAGQSTFMVEMSETANILNHATNRSFIIFDEIGRGTATYDGMAIAQAVLEFLDNLSPRTLFATHYHELTNLIGSKLKHTKCLTIDVQEHNNEIIFMHKIISGVANRSYGIHVANMAGMPSVVIKRANEVLAKLETAKNSNNIETEDKSLAKTQLSLFDY